MKNHNSKYTSLQFFLLRKNNTKHILIVISILILIGSFLRVYGTDKIYTEYDDIGVVSIHKGHIGTKNINIFEGFINYPLIVDMESAYSIENSMLLPFYIAYTWTYAPAQYVLFPLLLDEDDKYVVVVVKGRLISAFFSVMSLVLLAYLMYIVSGRALTWTLPIVLAIPIFSANSILYAHHMSPYSAYLFSTCLGLVLLYQYYISKITLRQIIVILAFLFYLSYLIARFAIPVLLIYLNKLRNQNNKRDLVRYLRDLISVLIGVAITFPGLLNIIINSRARDVISPYFKDTSSLVDIVLHLVIQFYSSVKSILYGVMRHDYLFTILFAVIGLLLIKKLFSGYKKLNESRIYIISILSILFQWIVLHVIGVLPLDETRHMLIILPLITMLIFYVLKDINMKGYGILAILIIALSSYSSTIYSVDLIKSKYSNFDYSFLDKRDEKVILLYRSTLGPMKYYDNGEKKVYFIDMNSFQNNYLTMGFPDEFLLVSQQTKISNEGLYDKYKEKISGLFCNYSIRPLYEKDSDIFFTYNNYPKSSNKNGMFVYQMKKEGNNQC